MQRVVTRGIFLLFRFQLLPEAWNTCYIGDISPITTTAQFNLKNTRMELFEKSILRRRNVAVGVYGITWTTFGLETPRSKWDTPPKVVENDPGGLPDTDGLASDGEPAGRCSGRHAEQEVPPTTGTSGRHLRRGSNRSHQQHRMSLSRRAQS